MVYTTYPFHRWITRSLWLLDAISMILIGCNYWQYNSYNQTLQYSNVKNGINTTTVWLHHYNAPRQLEWSRGIYISCMQGLLHHSHTLYPVQLIKCGYVLLLIHTTQDQCMWRSALLSWYATVSQCPFITHLTTPSMIISIRLTLHVIEHTGPYIDCDWCGSLTLPFFLLPGKDTRRYLRTRKRCFSLLQRNSQKLTTVKDCCV